MTPPGRARPAQSGFTVIELMVGLVVGLAIAVAAAGVMGVTESARRTTHATNDINQAGAYVAMLLDRAIRSAGTGLAPAAAYAYGCRLLVSKSGSQILPRAAALPAPFANVTTGTTGLFRLAPVVIGDGQTTPNISGAASDALIVMSGAAGQAEAPMAFTAFSQAAALEVASTVGVAANDLLLVADRQPAGTGTADCLVEQVSSTFVGSSLTTLDLAGTYYAASIGSSALTSVSSDGVALALGNVSGGNPPGFLVYGVGNHNTLYSYDLLQTTGTPLQPVADGVFELQALYGIDSDADGSVDSWVAPTGTHALSALMDGSSAAAGRLAAIKALRIGLILRTSRVEAKNSAPASLSLFSDLGAGLTYTRTLTTSQRKYRYRTLETTVPVRNNLLLTP